MKKIIGLSIIVILAVGMYIYNSHNIFENKDPVIISQDYVYLNEIASEDGEDLDGYEKAILFEPEKESTKHLSIDSEELKYVVSKNGTISGKLIVENKSDNEVTTYNRFFQGGVKLNYRLEENNEEVESYKVVTPPNSRSEVEVTLEIDQKAQEEFSYLPLDTSQPADGSALSLLRYYVADKEIDSISGIENQSEAEEVEITEADMQSYDFVTRPSIEESADGNFTIQTSAALLQSDLTIYFLDEEYNILHTIDDYQVPTKQKTDLLLPTEFNQWLDDSEAIYMLYYSYEGKEIVKDFVEAVNGLKPYMTTQQNLIKYSKEDFHE